MLCVERSRLNKSIGNFYLNCKITDKSCIIACDKNKIKTAAFSFSELDAIGHLYFSQEIEQFLRQLMQILPALRAVFIGHSHLSVLTENCDWDEVSHKVLVCLAFTYKTDIKLIEEEDPSGFNGLKESDYNERFDPSYQDIEEFVRTANTRNPFDPE